MAAKSWKEVRRKHSPETEEKIRDWVQQQQDALPLAQVRAARAMTQTRLAEIMEVDQAAISRLEKRTDMYLSTLRSYIAALGGSLEIRAAFPEGEIILDRLGTEEPAKPRNTGSEPAGHRRRSKNLVA